MGSKLPVTGIGTVGMVVTTLALSPLSLSKITGIRFQLLVRAMIVSMWIANKQWCLHSGSLK